MTLLDLVAVMASSVYSGCLTVVVLLIVKMTLFGCLGRLPMTTLAVTILRLIFQIQTSLNSARTRNLDTSRIWSSGDGGRYRKQMERLIPFV